MFGQSLGESPEARQAVCSQLVQDAWQHLSQLFGLSVASDGEGVGCEGGLHFGIVEMDDCSLICKHVDLEPIKTRFPFLVIKMAICIGACKKKITIKGMTQE